ncbi:MAG: hypothetical protein ACKPA9_02125 [Microcystis sp.]
MAILIGRIFGRIISKSTQKTSSPKPQNPQQTPSSKPAQNQLKPNQLPKDPQELVQQGWKDVTHPKQAQLGQRELEHPDGNLKVSFHPAREGQPGWKGKDHYHIHNPNATGKQNYYLDAQGNPVARGADASHISPSSSQTPSTRFENLQELKTNTPTSQPNNTPNSSPTSQTSSSPSPHH